MTTINSCSPGSDEGAGWRHEVKGGFYWNVSEYIREPYSPGSEAPSRGALAGTSRLKGSNSGNAGPMTRKNWDELEAEGRKASGEWEDGWIEKRVARRKNSIEPRRYLYEIGAMRWVARTR